jgi:hypothetical protein
MFDLWRKGFLDEFLGLVVRYDRGRHRAAAEVQSPAGGRRRPRGERLQLGQRRSGIARARFIGRRDDVDIGSSRPTDL